jgi:SAM-dependent methyltransferase
MPKNLVELLDMLHLVCPDDETILDYKTTAMCCPMCGRNYPFLDNSIIELLPLKPKNLDNLAKPSYIKGYISEFKLPIDFKNETKAWGAPEETSANWIKRRQRQVNLVEDLLEIHDANDKILICDFSAGAGYYTFRYAQKYKYVIHCDLSPSSLCYTYKKAKKSGMNNILFIRMDYFTPPFKNSLPRVICMDTLIRGTEHEKLLLKAINNSLSPDGIAIVDFHNWWHNPLRRMGLLPQNFVNNTSYARTNAEALLKEIGLNKYSYYPYHQEFSSQEKNKKIFLKMIPATRLLYRFEKHG